MPNAKPTAAVVAKSRKRTALTCRPAVETLETISLLSLTPLAGAYVPKPGAPASYTGMADYALYDSATSSFDVASSANPAERYAVQLGDPAHRNVPVVGQYLPKLNQTAGDNGLSDFVVYDQTAATFYVASVADPSHARIAVQLGDRSHDNVPVSGEFLPKLNQQGVYYGGLNDFAIYDKTAGAFYVASVADPGNTRIAVRLGDPGHVNTPIASPYALKENGQTIYDGLDDFAVYDHNAATFYVASAADPSGARKVVQIGDRNHDNVPVATTYLPKINRQGLYGGLSDFAVYDRTLATFDVASAADPVNTRMSVPIGDPSHENVPIVGQVIPKQGPLLPYNEMSDFTIFDATSSAFDVASAADASFRFAVPIGDASHAVTASPAQYLPRPDPAGIVPGQPDFAVFDHSGGAFYVASGLDPVHGRRGVAIGDAGHA